ncbi:MAG: DUF2520 domain-containing protein [Cryomorphaceae bacterium]|nr:MAG: DUF2520 domain-containing protein [Cryomorphaceae bacterium]
MPDNSFGIALIGAGRVASNLGTAFKLRGFELQCVLSRNEERGRLLAEELGTHFFRLNEAEQVRAHLFVIAVSDDAVQEVSEQLPAGEAVVVHTSGTRPMADLSKHPNRGVFYPLQTLTSAVRHQWSDVPFCLEASCHDALAVLKDVCTQLGAQHYELNSDQRARLHVAAVIANNFTNHLWGWSRRLLEEAEVDPAILHPLMRETLAKALTHDPYGVQTGPAVRGDEQTLRKHLAQLEEHPRLRAIYQLLTESIAAQSNGKL